MLAPNTVNQIELELEFAETKAWDALSRYKFWMFGYHAANWVNLNRIGGWTSCSSASRSWRATATTPRCSNPAASGGCHERLGPIAT